MKNLRKGQRISLKFKRGSVLLNTVVFAVIAIIIISSMVTWGANIVRSERHIAFREQAFHIAEAGLDYYRWHLAHAPSDYKDGSTTTGTYIHPFNDKDGVRIGQFELTITPPPIGSTVVKIKSVGKVDADPAANRTLVETLAIPSLAKFALVANDFMRFGAGTEVFGPVHSNGGIRFDGLAHNIVTSSKDKFVDPDVGGAEKFGVYTTVSPSDPNPPASVPNRPDVFMASRQFPVPTFDFVGITTDLSSIKTSAIASNSYYSASGAQGYRILLNPNDTYTLYRVNTLRSAPNNCSNSQNQANWGTWSIATQGGAQTLIGTYNMPSSGVIFFEDHIWVEGTINTARVTIAAAKFPDTPSTRKSITINNDISYTNYDSSDVISLIAQDNVNVGLYSDDDLRIDGALIAQNGRVGRYYYSSNCGTTHQRNSLTLFGMIGSNLRYGFAYTNGTGYDTRNITYDGNMLYAPPPSFPLTSDQYSIISWEEVK